VTVAAAAGIQPARRSDVALADVDRATRRTVGPIGDPPRRRQLLDVVFDSSEDGQRGWSAPESRAPRAGHAAADCSASGRRHVQVRYGARSFGLVPPPVSGDSGGPPLFEGTPPLSGVAGKVNWNENAARWSATMSSWASQRRCSGRSLRTENATRRLFGALHTTVALARITQLFRGCRGLASCDEGVCAERIRHTPSRFARMCFR
jgi:hypothetical protein